MWRVINGRIHTSVRAFFSKCKAERSAGQELPPALHDQKTEAELGDAGSEIGTGKHDAEFWKC